MDPGNLSDKDPLETAKFMVKVIQHETGIEVPAEAIVNLFEKRWATLSNLGHQIYLAIEKRKAPRPLSTYDDPLRWSQVSWKP